MGSKDTLHLIKLTCLQGECDFCNKKNKAFKEKMEQRAADVFQGFLDESKVDE